MNELSINIMSCDNTYLYEISIEKNSHLVRTFHSFEEIDHLLTLIASKEKIGKIEFYITYGEDCRSEELDFTISKDIFNVEQSLKERCKKMLPKEDAQIWLNNLNEIEKNRVAI